MKNELEASQHIPLWLINQTLKTYSSLDHSITAEVCIVGAGITGLTCAYLLLKEGLKVVVLDMDKIVSGESAKTSAHLSNALDDRYFNIIKVHGEENAKGAAESHAAAIKLIEDIITEEKIDCDFSRVNGYLFSTKKNSPEIQKEYEATQKLNIAAHLTELPEGIVSNERQCLEFKNQAQFHPVKYLSRLAEIITEKGGVIYEDTLVNDIDTDKNIVRLANGSTVTAKYVIQATNFPVQCSVFINTKIESNRSYVLGFAIPKDSLPMGLYWDNEDPYHYIRIQPNDHSIEGLSAKDDVLIVGGEDHRVGFEPEHNPYNMLEKWVRHTIPQAKEVLFSWSGQILEPVDYLAFIGQTLGGGENNFMVTADSGNGLTHGTLGAMMIKDLIQTKFSKWKDIYDPSRKSLSTAKDFIGNVSKSTVGYISYLTPGEIANEKELEPGQGEIMRKGASKIAAYRDYDGKLYEFSAICPHLKAILDWNPLEHTWDCPAHGSRFDAKGKLINGPATCGLTCLDKKKN